MKPTIEPEKVLVPTPQPVRKKKRSLFGPVAWIVTVAVVALVILYAVAEIRHLTASEPTTDAIQSYVTETCPDCPTCSDVADVQFLGRWMDALAKLDATPLEIWDLTHRAFIESRFNPATVVNGNYGICGINKMAWPEIAVTRLLTDPDYAAVECLNVYRNYIDLCGNDWQCCYKRGRKGCRDWQRVKR